MTARPIRKGLSLVASKVAAVLERRAAHHDHEWQARQRIAAKRWDLVHIAGDRAAPLNLPANWKAPR